MHRTSPLSSENMYGSVDVKTLASHVFWPDRPLAQTDLGIHSLLASLLMLYKRILSLMPHYAGLQTVY